MEKSSLNRDNLPTGKKYASPPVDKTIEWFYRIAASGYMPAGWFGPDYSKLTDKPVVKGRVKLEIVSHCWNYGNILSYQLSSLVLFPPAESDVTMTVFYSPEDTGTLKVLDYFGKKKIPGVTWNWCPLPKKYLFRRAVGRNLAAKNTLADWIFFTDCDVLFREKSIDMLCGEAKDRADLLIFPRYHMVSEMLSGDDPVLNNQGTEVRDIDPEKFFPEERNRAVGAFQITRGDAARLGGYCGNIGYYHRPVKRWRKTYEDRTFRWLLGTQGTMVEIPGFYRIRHAEKGRKGKKIGQSAG